MTALTVADVRVLEHVVARAGLAVRLTDLATGKPVRDGVTVTAWPAGPPARPDLAILTRSVTAAGVGGFHRLPGLRSFEDGSTPRSEWFASPIMRSSLPFVVRIDDASGEHLRVVREVRAPSATPIDIALPRSPAALAPSGWLTVIATIASQSGDPAAWALVQLTVGGGMGGAGAHLTGGVADERGAVVIPVPRAVAATSAGTPAEGPSWLVTVRVRYRPAEQRAAPGAAPDDPPTITSLLTQSPALVDDAGVLTGSLDRTLTARGPLEITSTAPPATPSALVVQPNP